MCDHYLKALSLFESSYSRDYQFLSRKILHSYIIWIMLNNGDIFLEEMLWVFINCIIMRFVRALAISMKVFLAEVKLSKM